LSTETQVHTAEVDRELVHAVEVFCETVLPIVRAQFDPDEMAVTDPDFDRAGMERISMDKDFEAAKEIAGDNLHSQPKDVVNLAVNPQESSINNAEAEDSEATSNGFH
jgi:hypothetical protein